LDRIRAGSLLGLPSRKRTEDTLQILRQRFVDPNPPIFSVFRGLSRDTSAFRDACYFEATRNDELLAFAAEHVLFDWWELGRSSITTEQLEQALLDTTPDPDLKASTPRMRNGANSEARVKEEIVAVLRRPRAR
jgi:hypothetical protein